MPQTPKVVFEGYVGYTNIFVQWTHLVDYQPIVDGQPVPVPTFNELTQVARSHALRFVRAQAYYYGTQPDETLVVHEEPELGQSSGQGA